MWIGCRIVVTARKKSRLEVIDARYLTRLPKLTPPENKEPNKE